ncbi:MAG: ATP synthase F1 subunit gamma [Bacteroidetes bacterium GWF2_33_16]|nr:MAG: ATP synthase F1 subunit gamma [Bacteroidetes bacterium GWE2_32_14]OFY04757.1 MAG: ATP synthase F1 subunit gamma [Bacteroidetes bacterium GWF2_33_16]
MGNLKEIRSRITSVKSTRQITSAMKMVSAAKLKKAQDAVINLRPYSHKLHFILKDISQTIEGEIENIFARTDEPEKILIVAVTSNKGLCGAFNANVIKQVVNLISIDFAGEFAEGKGSIISFGKKGTEYFNSKNYPVLFSNNHLIDQLSYEKALPYIEQIMNLYITKKIDKIVLVYNKFKNAGVQVLTVDNFLPIEITKQEVTEEHFDYIFEPSKEYIVKELIPRSLRLQLFEALLDSLAAEHGARMTAMHKATDNASEMIKSLQLNYNKARQASITGEILEIVGGAEALKK